MHWSNGFWHCTELRLLGLAGGRPCRVRARWQPGGGWTVAVGGDWQPARLAAGWLCGDWLGLRWRLPDGGPALAGVGSLNWLGPAARRRWRVRLRHGQVIA